MNQPIPDITVSIASYNTRELLRACLESLRQVRDEASLQIIVADNGSTDDTLEMLRIEYSFDVELLETGGNVGYGRANNAAFAGARGRYFVALNSDTTVQPNALRAMMRFMDKHPEAGACGPQLLNSDGTNQTSWGCDMTWRGLLEEQFGVQKLRGKLASSSTRMKHNEQAKSIEMDNQEPQGVEQICGACQFVRSAAYKQIGGYDPKYFMYHEDVDLNVRLRAAGWKCYFVSSAKVFHHLGASSERSWQSRARMVSALNKSRYYAVSKVEGRKRGEVLKAVFVFGAFLRLMNWTVRVLVLPNQLHRERVRLFREVLRQTARADRLDPRK